MAYQINVKRQELLACKEETLNNIKYIEKRIEKARSQKINSSYFDDDDDSDSDNMCVLDMGPSMSELKLQQDCLETCLHATQELTNLCVLQSEVNIMVNDPVYEREAPVTEKGTWREVTADCRVDLVPFSITFYTHQPTRPFGPISYRGLRVLPVKAAHENELVKSILPHVGTPSDAVEVLRSYAAAHRSRRTTLARLAEKYANSLFMEPMAEGGYIIKCANLMEVSWTLENRVSPLAPFHHSMKFDLEYMDEVYVKIISQAHRELSDPTLETDERTRLMSKIISTCLEAQGPTQELSESMESDIESEKLRKRRTTLDEEIEAPVNKKKKDSEIMAPPKSLPKKTKPKGKENNADNKKHPKSIKRSVTDDGDDRAKKTKLTEDNLIKGSNAIAKKKVGKDVALKNVLNKVTDKSDKFRDNIASKTNVDNNKVMKKVSNKEKRDISAKNSNKGIVMKVVAGHADKKNVATLKDVLDNKTGNVNNNIGSSKVDNVKDTQANVNNSTVQAEYIKKIGGSKKDVDNQHLSGKIDNVRKVTDVQNSNNFINNKKSNKTPVNKSYDNIKVVPDKVGNNKNAKFNREPKNPEQTNYDTSKKSMSTKGLNDKVRKTKVSRSQTNICSNAEYLCNEVSDGKNNPNVKSTGNVKENVAYLGDDFSTDNTNKKSINKTKSMKKSKAANSTVLNSGNLNTVNGPSSTNNNTKNVNDSDRVVVKNSSSDKNVKSKSKEISKDNVIKTRPTIMSKSENVTKEISVPNISKKQMSETNITKHVTKENPKSSALNNKNAKLNLNTEKTETERSSSFVNLKQCDTQLKSTIIKNSNTKSKNTIKIIHKAIEKNKIMVNKNNVTSLKNLVNKNVLVNKKFQMDLNERNSVETNESSGRGSLKQKYNTEKQILNTHDDANNKHIKPNLGAKINSQHVKNITNNKNLRSSKSPITKNRIKLLNPRTKISVNKMIVTDNKGKENEKTQKVNQNKNKIFTKIPQKFISVRDKITKENPLRINPRIINSSVKTGSQNSSRSSVRSLQKPMTGIPRLMKKPIC